MRPQRESTHEVRPFPRVPDYFGAYVPHDRVELALAVYEVGSCLHSPEGLRERFGRQVLDHLVEGGLATVEEPHGAEPCLALTDEGWTYWRGRDRDAGARPR